MERCENAQLWAADMSVHLAMSHRLEGVAPLKTQNCRDESPAVRNTQDQIGQGLFQDPKPAGRDPRPGTHLKSCKMRL